MALSDKETGWSNAKKTAVVIGFIVAIIVAALVVTKVIPLTPVGEELDNENGVIEVGDQDNQTAVIEEEEAGAGDIIVDQDNTTTGVVVENGTTVDIVNGTVIIENVSDSTTEDNENVTSTIDFEEPVFPVVGDNVTNNTETADNITEIGVEDENEQPDIAVNGTIIVDDEDIGEGIIAIN